MRSNVPRYLPGWPPVPEWNSLSQGFAVLVGLVGIATSEWLVFTGAVETALWGHFLTFLYCTAAPLVVDRETGTFRALSLVPLFRLVNLGVPVFVELTLLWLPFVYGPLLPGFYLIANRLAPIGFSWRKLRQLTLWLPIALLLSLTLSTVEYHVIQPPAMILTWDPLSVLTLGLVMIGFVGLVEELLFRAILQRTFVDRFGTVLGILLAAAVFGTMHAAFGNPLEIVFATVFGVILGGIYHWTDNIAIVTVIHGSLNVFLFGLYPLHGVFVTF